MPIKKMVLMLLALLLSIKASAEGNFFQSMANTQGFFFFYSAGCPHCQHFAPILKRFSQRYGFKVLAISMDGGFLDAFPNAVINQNQAAILQVKMLPSLFLMNPQTQTASLIAEGNIDETELAVRLLKISTMQKEKGAS